MARQTNINVNVNSTSAVKGINTIKKAFIDLNNTINQTTNNGKIKIDIDFGNFDINMLKDLSKSLSKLKRNMDALNSSAMNYARNGQIFSVTTNNITNNVTRVSRASNIMTNGFFQSALALDLFRRGLSYLLKDYSQLTDATFGVGIAGQLNISEINQLNEAFLNLSTTVPHSAKSLASSVNDLIRTGRSFEESKKIIEQVAILSTASGDSLKDTARVVTKVMTALDIDADRTVDTLNAMHSTAIRTASDMGYLAEAFKNVAGTASVLTKSSGLSGEELNNYKQDVLDLTLAISGTFANLGLSASQAGTKTKVLYSKLVAMEKTAKSLFEQATRINDVKINGEFLDSEKLAQLAKTDLRGTVELLSKLYTEGKLSSQVLQKMFTGRHFMEIAEILTQINGNVDTFVDSVATGVNYSQDFYKNMFNINEQVKLLSNNMQKMSQGYFGIGESITGLTMVANDVLPKLSKNGNNTVKTFTAMSTSFVGVGFSVSVIMKYLVPLVKSLSLLNPITIGIGAVASVITLMGKSIYDTNKAFADTNINLDNIKLSQSDIENNLKNINSYLTSIKNNIAQNLEMNIDTSQASDVLSILTKKIDTFKEAMIAINGYKVVNTITVEDNLKEYQSSLFSLTENFNKLKSEYEKTLGNVVENVSSRQNILFKDTSKKILEYYIKLKEENKTSEKIQEEIFKYAESFGFSKRQTKKLIGNLSTKELEDVFKDFNKEKETTKNEYDKIRKEFEDYLTQMTKNQEAISKLRANTADTKAELYRLTGKYKELEGLEGISELFKDSELESSNIKIKNISFQIENLKNKLVSLKNIDSDDNEKVYADIKKQIDDLENSREKEETYLKTKKDLLKSLNIEELKNIQYSDKMFEPLYKILATKLKISELESSNVLENDPRLIALNDQLKTQIALVNYLSEENVLKQNRTEYQIKYVNYLKSNLDLELESTKIGKTKGEQEVLTYSYKLKQLELDKKIADTELQTSKEVINNLKVESSLRQKLNLINSSESGQKFIDDFYAKYKNVLSGKGGEELKNVYEAVKVYTNALVKSENISDKLGLESLKVVREFIDDIPKSIKTSIVALNELANEGLIPFNNYGNKILEQLENTFNEHKNKVWGQYSLGSLNLVEAINNNISNINFAKTLEGKSIEIEKYFKNIKSKIENDDELSKIYLELDSEKTTTIEEKLAFIMKVLLGEQKDLLEVQKNSLEVRKQELLAIEKQVKLLSSAGNLLTTFGDIFQINTISDIGDLIKGFSSFEDDMKNIHIDWKQIFDGKDLQANFTQVFEGAFKGMNLGNIVGTAVGNITGGGIASQQGGALAGLISGAFGMTGWGALATTVGGSLIGGLFDRGDDKAEAERRTKESNKLYNKNTEALQKLAQNMSNLSGGVDSLNNTLISAVSKIPTIDNINGVTDAMTNMYKTMEKTRKFSDVAYQVTKTKKKKGFLGIGGGSTSWTETIEVSVNEMLRRYGFKGALEDMTSQQIRDFSKWLDNYDLGDSDNFGVLADALEDYAEGLDKFDKNIQNFFRDTTMEAFAGISSLEQESLRQQIEDFYKNLGFQIDEETSKQIDKLAEEMSVMVTIMSDVRNEFLNQWRETGQSAGSVFLSSMKPYIDAMLGNISQIYYDVYFSGVNENLEKEFKNLSEQLVELKKQGKDLDWSSVTDKLSSSFGNVLNSILATKNETASFNEILMELQKQALESGLSLSEIFDLGLMSGTQKDVMEAFKESLTSSDSENTLNSIGEMLGDKIGETMANKMLDNLLSDRVLEFSAQIDKVMSGNLNFDSLAELSNQALSVGLMMSAEADRLSAIKELFNFKSDIEYTTQNENIEYSSGVSQNVTNIYNLSSSVEAGSVIEADNIERLAEGLLDVMLEKLKVDKGIVLG